MITRLQKPFSTLLALLLAMNTLLLSGGMDLTFLEQKVFASGEAFDDFGRSVALSGFTALVGVIGTNHDQGSAYIYQRRPNSWAQQGVLTASDREFSDFFGYSVALSGNTALVGAVGKNGNEGCAYVFVRSGTVWTQQAKLKAADGEDGDYFGRSVALSGNTALVGAIWDDVGSNTWQGSAYVFVRSGTTWTQQAQLIAADGTTGDYFGYSVALSGDTALVGAVWDGDSGYGHRGSAYVFTRSGTSWTQQVKLTAADGAGNDLFGGSVALAGDTALVGAYGDDYEQGSAYVFARSGASWTQEAKLTAVDGEAGDWFGGAVALAGDTALVAACLDNVDANTRQGSAYVFTRSGTTWIQQEKLVASDGASNDRFGDSVALTGDAVLVGAPEDDIGENMAQGSAYIYDFLTSRIYLPVVIRSTP